MRGAARIERSEIRADAAASAAGQAARYFAATFGAQIARSRISLRSIRATVECRDGIPVWLAFTK